MQLLKALHLHTALWWGQFGLLKATGNFDIGPKPKPGLESHRMDQANLILIQEILFFSFEEDYNLFEPRDEEEQCILQTKIL